MAGVAFASIRDLEIRLGHTLAGAERDRATALLSDASAMIRAVARSDWEDPPPIITTICLTMATRAWHNPEGVRQQTLGDLSMTFGSVETGVFLTPDERRLIRMAAGFGVELGSVQLTSGYDVPTTTVYVPTSNGGDWLPWLAGGRT